MIVMLVRKRRPKENARTRPRLERLQENVEAKANFSLAMYSRY